MNRLITVEVQSPCYGICVLDVERVIAIIPEKRWILFESVYGKLDKENFDKVAEVWRRLKEK